MAAGPAAGRRKRSSNRLAVPRYSKTTGVGLPPMRRHSTIYQYLYFPHFFSCSEAMAGTYLVYTISCYAVYIPQNIGFVKRIWAILFSIYKRSAKKRAVTHGVNTGYGSRVCEKAIVHNKLTLGV